MVQRKYQQDYDIAPPITFGNDHITLDIPEDGTETSNGWRIVPQYIPMVTITTVEVRNLLQKYVILTSVPI